MNIETPTKLFISGSWKEPVLKKTFPIVNPATEQVIFNASAATKEDVDLAVSSAKSACTSWRNTTGKQRSDILKKIADGITSKKDYLAKLDVLDSGKPLSEATADIEDAIGCFEYMASLAIKLDEKQGRRCDLPDERFECKLMYEPVGVVAAIVPWNYPLLMSVWKVAPALAAGCTIILKPSELTPLTALELGIIASDADLPSGVLNILTGYGLECGEPLSKHKDVDKITFTGSVQTGKKLMNIASQDIKNITLELGGKSAIIVFDDCTVNIVVEWIMMGIFFNAGQVCSATSRILVHQNIHAKLLEQLLSEVSKLVIGDGMDPKVNFGPVVSKGQFEKILGYFDIAKKEGLELAVGGKRSNRTGYFIEPTIYTNVPTTSKLWREEIFGPVLCMRTFKTEKEAISLANDTEFGLAAAVMSNDLELCDRVARELEAGTVWINCSQPCFSQAPWGGMKKSGIGRELGPTALDAYLETKQVTRFDNKGVYGWYQKIAAKVD